MGVDVSSVSGIGINTCESELADMFFPEFDKDSSTHSDFNEFVEDFKHDLFTIEYSGSSYSGNFAWHIFIDGFLDNGFDKAIEKLKDFKKFIEEKGFDDQNIKEIHATLWW